MSKQIRDENGNVYVKKKPIFLRWWFILLALIVVIALWKGTSSDDSTAKEQQPTKTSDSTQTNNATEEKTEADNTIEKETQVEEEPPIQITAIQLCKEYGENEVKADKNYKGKTVEITGTINDIGVVLEQTYVTIDGDDSTFTDAECYFDDEAEIDKVSELSKGQEIKVIGVIKGKSLNVDVEECKIVE